MRTKSRVLNLRFLALNNPSTLKLRHILAREEMGFPFKLSEKKNELLRTKGHLIVLGGPGAGKTTISLLKARTIIEQGLRTGQKVLFLSFARSTVTRVGEQAKEIITPAIRPQLEINTYHGFAWNLLKSHGYLLNGKPRLRLLPPPEAASRLAHIRNSREQEKRRLFFEEGLVHFDLFAGLTADLLSLSQSLSSIISDAYPYIILDEFQDTNADEWRMTQRLGKKSTLIALADPDQRIYEFRGADPARITEFISAFKPTRFNFGSENNRSNGTDIAKFGNDLLTGQNKTQIYKNIHLKRYKYLKGAGAHYVLKSEVLSACERVRTATPSRWSLGVFIPSNSLLLEVSDYLAAGQRFSSGKFLRAVSHQVSINMEGPSLAAIAIARLMEKSDGVHALQHMLISDLCGHIRGRKGDEPASQNNLKLAAALMDYTSTGKVLGSTKKAIITETMRIASVCQTFKFSGDPTRDWETIRNIIATSESEVLRQIALDAQYSNLNRPGGLLNTGLATLWRSKGSYAGAYLLVCDALAQEHFSALTSVATGVHLMTIHKAKAKEFDEVIIYEGFHNGRLAIEGKGDNAFNQSLLALRVAVTRARKRTTIITPSEKNCPFLY